MYLRPRLWLLPGVYDDIDPDLATFTPDGSVWHESLPSIPYAVLDQRRFDLPLAVWADPDAALMKAFRRLETIVAERFIARWIDPNTMPASNLFGTAVNTPDGPLTWRDLPSGEVVGRNNRALRCSVSRTNIRDLS